MLKFALGFLLAASGHAATIEGSWKVINGRLVYEVAVPANTTAKVVLPGQPARAVPSGRHRFEVTLPGRSLI